MRDYREKLRDVLEEIHASEGLTRYKIAKRSGISEQTLSNVMHKRRNLSIDALEKLLLSVGYEIHFLRSSDAGRMLNRPMEPASTNSTPEEALSH